MYSFRSVSCGASCMLLLTALKLKDEEMANPPKSNRNHRDQRFEGMHARLKFLMVAEKFTLYQHWTYIPVSTKM